MQVAHTVPPEGGAHVQDQHLLVVGHGAGREPVGGLLLDPEIGVGIERDVPVYVGREGLASFDQLVREQLLRLLLRVRSEPAPLSGTVDEVHLVVVPMGRLPLPDARHA